MELDQNTSMENSHESAKVAGASTNFDRSAESDNASEANTSTISMDFPFIVQNPKEQRIGMELDQNSSMEKSHESANVAGAPPDFDSSAESDNGSEANNSVVSLNAEECKHDLR